MSRLPVMTCPYCPAPGAAANPGVESRLIYLIHDFGHFAWIVGEHQFYPGYSLLVAKRHAREIFDLQAEEQTALTDALTRAARAIQKAYGPRKINYAALGNQVEHLHWHLFPRYDGDPHALAHPWANEASFGQYRTGPELAREVAARLLKALD